MFNPNEENGSSSRTNTVKHKEEGSKRSVLDSDDHNRIMMELQKHAHPLTWQCLHLINIVNRKVADDTMNVPDALMIGEEMKNNFITSLPNGFHSSITGKVKNMKKGIRVSEKMVYDMEALFSHLLIVVQVHNISIKTVFEYELFGVPSAIIDEFGLLRKGNKANLVKKFAVTLENPCSPDELMLMQVRCCTILSGPLEVQYLL